MICRLKKICLLFGLSIVLILVNKSAFYYLQSSKINLNENQNQDFFKNVLDDSNSHLVWFVQVNFISSNSKRTNF